jgi:hypothetical protein
MKQDRNPRELTATLTWHFEAKNLALRNSLQFRCPLQVAQQHEMRLYYSDYFAHLISATELLRESEYTHRQQFKALLEGRFVFEGHPDGTDNYAYVRELRNSVIHRGYDITSAAHIDGDFPRVVAPPSVTNRDGTKTYSSLGYYLIDVISKCEAVVGHAVADHLADSGLLEPQVTQTEAVTRAMRSIDESHAMPQWAKEMGRQQIAHVDYLEMQRAQASKLVELLRTNALAAIQHDLRAV